MQGRRKWSALPAGRHVGAPKIGDRIDAGQRGDRAGVADLQRVWVVPAWCVEQGLPVGADRDDILCRNRCRADQPQRGIGKRLGDPLVQRAEGLQR